MYDLPKAYFTSIPIKSFTQEQLDLICKSHSHYCSGYEKKLDLESIKDDLLGPSYGSGIFTSNSTAEYVVLFNSLNQTRNHRRP